MILEDYNDCYNEFIIKYPFFLTEMKYVETRMLMLD